MADILDVPTRSQAGVLWLVNHASRMRTDTMASMLMAALSRPAVNACISRHWVRVCDGHLRLTTGGMVALARAKHKRVI